MRRRRGRREGRDQEEEERCAAAGVIITEGPGGGLRDIPPDLYYTGTPRRAINIMSKREGS